MLGWRWSRPAASCPAATPIVCANTTRCPGSATRSAIWRVWTRAREGPNRGGPLDALRSLEQEHVFAKLHDFYYVTVGVGTAVNNARRFGEEIARELHAADVQGVIL